MRLIQRPRSVVALGVWLACALVSGAAQAPDRPGELQTPGTKVFEVTAKRYTFTPETIEVSQGDTVKLIVTTGDGTHGFEIKKFRINKEIPKGDDPVTIQFVADQPGTFEIKCSEYCGKGHKRMKGTLVVLPRAAK